MEVESRGTGQILAYIAAAGVALMVIVALATFLMSRVGGRKKPQGPMIGRAEWNVHMARGDGGAHRARGEGSVDRRMEGE